jgi:hypothetical protein
LLHSPTSELPKSWNLVLLYLTNLLNNLGNYITIPSYILIIRFNTMWILLNLSNEISFSIM